MNLLQFIKIIWENRKATRYIMENNWKVPLCECSEYLNSSNCEHIEEARQELKALLFPTK